MRVVTEPIEGFGPRPKGFLGSRLSLLDKRVNLVAGLRYDDYKGANLSDSAIAGMDDEDAADYVIAIMVNAFATVKPARVTD